MTDKPAWSIDDNAYVKRPGLPPRRHADGAETPSLLRDANPREQVAETGIAWDPTALELRKIRASETDRSRARFRASLPDLIWNAARYEGNTFTLPEVKTLLEGVTVGGHPLEDQEQIMALSDAYSALDALVGEGGFSLTKRVSDRLHSLVALHEAIESGHFRGEGSTGGGGSVRLSNGGTVEGIAAGEGGQHLIDRFDKTIAFLDHLDDPRERALAYFAAATRSQFYFDGNKRTARLMMTGELMSNGFDTVNIPYSRQYEFNTALDRLFESDDGTTLMAFVADCA